LHHDHVGAQRASRRRLRSLLTGILATLVLVTATAATAPDARAATQKVVVVVGPVGSRTAEYRAGAHRLADLARAYGASVTEILSPNATWARVSAAAKGANLLIYLGHGNGWPSPYGPFATSSKDGMGLNAAAGHGNSNVKYYGEDAMATLGLAPAAVVVLNRLCYASGNSEWGSANPSRATAIKRADNYGAGFLRAGAKAVFASGITDVAYVLRGLFRGSAKMTMAQLFLTDPTRTGSYAFAFNSVRTPGAAAKMDPYAPNRYYRSVVGWLNTTVGGWRAG
jgi:hypothetical protein